MKMQLVLSKKQKAKQDLINLHSIFLVITFTPLHFIKFPKKCPKSIWNKVPSWRNIILSENGKMNHNKNGKQYHYVYHQLQV